MILTLEQQVCSLESAKKLKKLGVPQNSLFSFGKYLTREGYGLSLTSKWEAVGEPFIYAAFTVAELGYLLPENIDCWKQVYNSDNQIEWRCIYHKGRIVWDINEAEARAKMLIWLLENNLINLKEIQ
jgi:hypothetical protein